MLPSLRGILAVWVYASQRLGQKVRIRARVRVHVHVRGTCVDKYYKSNSIES